MENIFAMEMTFLNLIENISIFGDSILKEVVVDKDSSHYYTPKETGAKKIAEALSVQIKNNSRFGCTIDKGYEQLQNALNKGLLCDIVVLGYGGNDCDYNWAEVAENPYIDHSPHTPIDKFEKIYLDMINILKEKGIMPLLMSLPPIDAEKYFAWITRGGINKENLLKWIGDIQMIYRFQELYSGVAAKVAYETGSLFVDVRKKFLDKRNYTDLICYDGIHPNLEGHALIDQAFLEFANNYLNEKKQLIL